VPADGLAHEEGMAATLRALAAQDADLRFLASYQFKRAVQRDIDGVASETAEAVVRSGHELTVLAKAGSLDASDDQRDDRHHGHEQEGVHH
jgi:hypothetical protein